MSEKETEKKLVFNLEELGLILHSLSTDEEVLLAERVSRGFAKMRLANAVQEQLKNDDNDSNKRV